MVKGFANNEEGAALAPVEKRDPEVIKGFAENGPSPKSGLIRGFSNNTNAPRTVEAPEVGPAPERVAPVGSKYPPGAISRGRAIMDFPFSGEPTRREWFNENLGPLIQSTLDLVDKGMRISASTIDYAGRTVGLGERTFAGALEIVSKVSPIPLNIGRQGDRSNQEADQLYFGRNNRELFGTAIDRLAEDIRVDAKKVARIVADHPEWSPEQIKDVADLLSSPKKVQQQIMAGIPFAAGAGAAGLTAKLFGIFMFSYGIGGQSAYDTAFKETKGDHKAAMIHGQVGGLLEALLETAFGFGRLIKMSGASKAQIIQQSTDDVIATFGDKVVDFIMGRAGPKGLIAVREGGIQAITENVQGTFEELAAKGYGSDRLTEGGASGFATRRVTEAVVALPLGTAMKAVANDVAAETIKIKGMTQELFDQRAARVPANMERKFTNALRRQLGFSANRAESYASWVSDQAIVFGVNRYGVEYDEYSSALFGEHADLNLSGQKGPGTTVRGPVVWERLVQQGRAIEEAFSSETLEDFSKNLAPAFKENLQGEDAAHIEQVFEGNDVQLAEDLQQWLEDGTAPTAQLSEIYEVFGSWARSLQRRIGRGHLQVPRKLSSLLEKSLSVDSLAVRVARDELDKAMEEMGDLELKEEKTKKEKGVKKGQKEAAKVSTKENVDALLEAERSFEEQVMGEVDLTGTVETTLPGARRTLGKPQDLADLKELQDQQAEVLTRLEENTDPDDAELSTKEVDRIMGFGDNASHTKDWIRKFWEDKVQDLKQNRGITEGETAPGAERVLREAPKLDKDSVLHGVTGTEDLKSISEQGLKPGTAVSGTEGQATGLPIILVFGKTGVKGTEHRPGDSTTTESTDKPKAILVDVDEFITRGSFEETSDRLNEAIGGLSEEQLDKFSELNANYTEGRGKEKRDARRELEKMVPGVVKLINENEETFGPAGPREPFGGTEQIVREVREAFPGVDVFLFNRGSDGDQFNVTGLAPLGEAVEAPTVGERVQTPEDFSDLKGMDRLNLQTTQITTPDGVFVVRDLGENISSVVDELRKSGKEVKRLSFHDFQGKTIRASAVPGIETVQVPTESRQARVERAIGLGDLSKLPPTEQMGSAALILPEPLLEEGVIEREARESQEATGEFKDKDGADLGFMEIEARKGVEEARLQQDPRGVRKAERRLAVVRKEQQRRVEGRIPQTMKLFRKGRGPGPLAASRGVYYSDSESGVEHALMFEPVAQHLPMQTRNVTFQNPAIFKDITNALETYLGPDIVEQLGGIRKLMDNPEVIEMAESMAAQHAKARGHDFLIFTERGSGATEIVDLATVEVQTESKPHREARKNVEAAVQELTNVRTSQVDPLAALDEDIQTGDISEEALSIETREQTKARVDLNGAFNSFLSIWSMSAPVRRSESGSLYADGLNLASVRMRMLVGKVENAIVDTYRLLGSRFGQDRRWLKEIAFEGSNIRYTNNHLMIESVPNLRNIQLDPPNARVESYRNFFVHMMDYMGSKAQQARIVQKLQGGIERPFRQAQDARFPHFMHPRFQQAIMDGPGFPDYDAFVKAISEAEGISVKDVNKQIKDFNDPIKRHVGIVQDTRAFPNMPDFIKLKNGKWVELLVQNPYRVMSKATKNQAQKISHADTFGQEQAALGKFDRRKSLAELADIVGVKRKPQGQQEWFIRLREKGAYLPGDAFDYTLDYYKSLGKFAGVDGKASANELMSQIEKVSEVNLDAKQVKNLKNLAKELGGIDTTHDTPTIFRLVRDRLFGPNADVVKHLRDGFAKEGGNVKQFDAMTKVWWGVPYHWMERSMGSRLLKMGSNILGAHHTSLAFTVNIFQPFKEVLPMVGWQNMNDAYAEMIGDYRTTRSQMVAIGALNQHVNTWSWEQSHRTEAVGRMWRQAFGMVGLNLVTEANNVVAAKAFHLMGEQWQDGYFSPGDATLAKTLRFSDKEIQAIRDGKMTNDMVARVAIEGTGITQFMSEHPHNRGLLENIPWLRMIFNYNQYMVGTTRKAIRMGVEGKEVLGPIAKQVRRGEGVSQEQLVAAFDWTKRAHVWLAAGAGVGLASWMLRGIAKGKVPSREDLEEASTWDRLVVGFREVMLFGGVQRMMDPFNYGDTTESLLIGLMPQIKTVLDVTGLAANMVVEGTQHLPEGSRIPEEGKFGKLQRFPLVSQANKLAQRHTPVAKAVVSWVDKMAFPEKVMYDKTRAMSLKWAKEDKRTRGFDIYDVSAPSNPLARAVVDGLARFDEDMVKEAVIEYVADAHENKGIPIEDAYDRLRAAIHRSSPIPLNKDDRIRFLHTIRKKDPKQADFFEGLDLYYNKMVDDLIPGSSNR